MYESYPNNTMKFNDFIYKLKENFYYINRVLNSYFLTKFLER